MKITITYKDDVFRVYKDGKETYTRKWLSVAMRGVNLPLSSGLFFLLLVEGGVDADNVEDAIECLDQAGIYEFNA